MTLQGLIEKTSNGARAKNAIIGSIVAGFSALLLIIGISTYVLADPSSAPRDVLAQAGDQSVTVTWVEPESDGGEEITHYIVEHTPEGGEGWVESDEIGAAERLYAVTGLTNGTNYEFRVAAYNESGAGAYSEVATATPESPLATAPLNLTATAGNQQVGLVWDVPSYTGTTPITDYTVEYRQDGETEWSEPEQTIDTSSTVTGLTNGTTYEFRVAAVNSSGSGEFATTSATPQTLPGAPSITNVTASSGQAVVTFTAPESNGGSAIIDYTVTSNPGGVTQTAASSPITVTGLDNGTAYTFTVTARNVLGSGAASDPSSSVTPASVPDAPTGLSATPASGQVSLSWTAPAETGGLAITDYAVQYKPASGSTWENLSGTSTATSATVTGLTNGTEYDFRVAAVTPAGTGSYGDTVSSTPFTTAAAPTGLSVDPKNGEVDLSWSAPSNNGGSAVTGYVVQYKTTAGSDWTDFNDGTSTVTSATVTGLTNGTSYDFRVAAINAADRGQYSSVVGSTPRTVPGAPVIGTATRGNGQATVTFSAPANDGGAPVTLYTVTSSTGGHEATSSTSPITVTGLTNGTAYTFTVTATNAAGEGAASAASNSVTPGSAPGVPTALTVSPGSTQATLNWTAPASTGGYAVQDYVVEYRLQGGDWTIFADGSSAATSATVTGLTNGSLYEFRVAAANEVGQGAFSTVASATPRTTPGAPAGLSATPGAAQVALSWSAPASNGGSAVTDYRVEYKLDADSDWTVFDDGVSTATSATVAGLSNGSLYNFRVIAVNVAGNGSPSSTVDATPRTVPGAPAIGTATRGDGQATVTFSAPANDGGAPVTLYTVTSSPDGHTATATSVEPVTVTGLSNGTSYTFTVVATNEAGNSPASAASNSVTPASVPGAPAIVSVTPGDGAATVTFIAPADNGGSAITGYTVTSTPGNFTVTSTGVEPITVTGLANGTAYTFTITATNDVGASANSAPSLSVTPRTAPDAPTSVVAVRGDEQAVVSFDAPAFNGGASITEYTVTSNPGDVTATGTSSPITVSGLDNGTEYTFTVVATNVAGDSPASSPSNAVTPGAVPGSPSGLTATPGNGQVSLSWSAPASDGGSAIVDYTIEYKLSSASVWTEFADGLSTNTSLTVSGLNNGSSYDFRVAAVNDVGPGPASSVASSTPRTYAGAPTGLVVVAGNGEVGLLWTAPTNNGGSAITDYVVQYRLDSDSTWVTASDGVSVTTSVSIIGLTNGSLYDFRVAAVNAAGTGTYSTVVSATPDLTYPQISSVEVVKTDGDASQVTIKWKTDILSNAQVEYSVDSSFGESSLLVNVAGALEHSIVIAGLDSCTTYRFRVVSESLIDGGRTVGTASTFKTNGCPPEEDEEETAKPSDKESKSEDSKSPDTPVSSGSPSPSGQDGDTDIDTEIPAVDEPTTEDEDATSEEPAGEDDAEEEDAGSGAIVWIVAAVVGVGAVLGVATARRRTE